MDVAEFAFDLPDELIAQEPPAPRGESRLMVVPRAGGSVHHTEFRRLVDHLHAGDLLVLNNTKVFPARLLGKRLPSGGAVECLLVRQLPNSNSQLPNEPTTLERGMLGVGRLGAGSSEVWEALVHPGQKLKEGARLV